jgi:hypothetical protein
VDSLIPKLAKAALQLDDEIISIGGGEPTIAVVNTTQPPWLITNGKLTKDDLKLADLTKRGIVYCELSKDKYHDPIDPKVINAFKDHIRNTTKKKPTYLIWQM